ncbi:MAG TPA: polymer-forming cytoskeletal protein, partial [Aquaticitalea sp.]|nr:polymer-forming cytoskeletal protein [Aquaticitalea sp.]
TIQGNVKTPGKVVIGRTGIIKGTLTSANADIEGKFSGKLMLSDTLSLKSTAYVEGEVEVGKLAVEPGATFNATCAMKGAIKELGNGGQRPQQQPQERKEGQTA